METLTLQDILALNKAVAELYALKSTENFHRRALLIVSDLIDCDRVSYNSIDDDGRYNKLIHKSDEDQADADALKEPLQAFVHEHPYWNYPTGVKTILDMMPKTAFHKTGLYNEFYKKLDIEFQMLCDLPAAPEKMELYALSRGPRDFNERDKLIFTLLRPHLAVCFRNTVELERFVDELALLRIAAEAEERGTVLITGKGKVAWMSRLARCWIDEYFGRSQNKRGKLPSALKEWIKNQLLIEASGLEKSPLIVEQPAPGRGAKKRLMIELVGRHDKHREDEMEEGRYMLIMSEKKASPAEAYKLTPRQAAVLHWLAQGKTNIEIGMIIGISSRTVEHHMAAIFEKMGVETRMAAATMLREK